MIQEQRLRSYYRGRRVLITGVNGFLGVHLARRLSGLGARMTGFHRPGSKARLGGLPGLRPIGVEITDPIAVAAAVGKPSVIFHLAAYGVSPRDHEPAAAAAVNVVGFVNLVTALEGVRMDAFVNTGSCFEYRTDVDRPLREDDALAPDGAYAQTKTAAVQLGLMLARTRGLPVVTLRPFTFYGPMERPDRLIPNAMRCALRGEALRMTAGKQTRDFIYVDDVVEAYLYAALPPVAAGEVFNIGSGRATTVLDAVKRILKLSGSGVAPLAGAVPYRDNEIWHLRADIRKAGRRLGWRPTVSLDDGLRRTLDWHRKSMEGVVERPAHP